MTKNVKKYQKPTLTQWSSRVAYSRKECEELKIDGHLKSPQASICPGIKIGFCHMLLGKRHNNILSGYSLGE